MEPPHNTEERPPHPFLEPLVLPGGCILPNRILPGPMDGITTGSFCSVLTRAACARCWITPFIRVSTGVPRLVRLRHRLLPYLNTGLPVIAQIMGTDTGRLAETASRLTEIGAVGVDLNCGCPSRTAVTNGGGGARLQHPDWILATLKAMRNACPDASVSVKLRTGFADSAELADILAAAREAHPDFVILHFRTVAEGYQAVPDGYERLARARESLPDTLLFGSGDLFTPDDALRMRSVCGVDGVAPARGLLRSPHLLRDIEDVCAGRKPDPNTLTPRLSVLRDIALTAEAPPGRTGIVMELARHMFGCDHELFRGLAACADLKSAAALLDRWLVSPAEVTGEYT